MTIFDKATLAFQSMKLKSILVIATKTFLIALLVSQIGCTTFDKSKIDNLNKNKVVKIGHAGSGFNSLIPFNSNPSNSYKSLFKALVENKADGVEVDIQMTADDRFVLYHDKKLGSQTNTKGCISEMSYLELLNVKYKLGFPLDSLIGLMKSMDEFPYLHLDIRNYSECLTLAENEVRELQLIKQLIARLNSFDVPKSKVMIISLSKPLIVEALRLNCPYLISLEEVVNFDSGLEWVKSNHLNYLTIKRDLLSKDKSKKAHEAGVQIVTFGAKSKNGNKKLLQLNPDFIQSNNLGALNELLAD